MADSKSSALAAILASAITGGTDIIYVVAAGVSKKMTFTELKTWAAQSGADIKTLYEAESDTNAFTDTLKTKLDAIEGSATADQTGAEIKTAYQGEANAFTDTKNTKLAGIEGSATADQSDSEIETAYNTQVAIVTQGDAEAGTATVAKRFTAERVKQAIAALERREEVIVVSVSDETTDLTTGTAKVTFRMPYAMTLSDIRDSVTTAPTGSVLTVDVNEGGTTILSTKLTIDATEKTSETAVTAAVISDSSLADDAEITIDIDAIGSTIAGAGLKVYLIGTRT